jgi:hypothetical protein
MTKRSDIEKKQLRRILTVASRKLVKGGYRRNLSAQPNETIEETLCTSSGKA